MLFSGEIEQSYYYLCTTHNGPSMMSRERPLGKTPKWVYRGMRGFSGERCLERPLKSPLGTKGSFPGTLLTVHSVPYKTNKLNWTSQVKVAYSAFFHKCTAQDNIEDLKYGSFFASDRRKRRLLCSNNRIGKVVRVKQWKKDKANNSSFFGDFLHVYEGKCKSLKNKGTYILTQSQ